MKLDKKAEKAGRGVWYPSRITICRYEPEFRKEKNVAIFIPEEANKNGIDFSFLNFFRDIGWFFQDSRRERMLAFLSWKTRFSSVCEIFGIVVCNFQ